MIFEMQTYRVRPHTVAEFESRFAEAYEARTSLSPLGAAFHTEFGPLNRVIMIWPYENLAERDRVREQAAKSWSLAVDDLVDEERSEIFSPAPFAPTLGEGDLGPVIELRNYTLRAGLMEQHLANWATAIEYRRGLSPLVGVMHSRIGAANQFVHIWGYRSLEHRAEIRRAARDGNWPPPSLGPGGIVRQRNMILTAAPYSPVR